MTRASNDESRFIHIPTPGDHYSPSTGSAIPTIIYEMSRPHAARGGETTVIVGRGTRHDYPVGTCVEVSFPGGLAKWEKVLDVGLGRLGRPRLFGTRRYSPAVPVIDPSFSGPIFLHNSPVALWLFKKRFPRATICLWANNELFRTYTDREVARVAAVSDRLIFCSEFTASCFRDRLRRHADKVKVVPNGVDLGRFQPPGPKPPPDEPIVLFVGRVVPEKGPDLLLQAATKIYGKVPPFKIRIVGSSGFSATDPLTDYEKQLRQLAEPIADIVAFQPFVDRAQVLEEYRAASIFCVPSNWDEPFGLTVAEGLASGLPMIVARRGGIPEVAGDAALFFDPPGIDEFAEHLLLLLDDPSARSEWGERARRRAVALDWANAYEKLLSALRGV